MQNNDDSKEEGDAGTALYAFHQTRQYSAPPVINGRIPKNLYGNLDIYVPSMVPEGGSHILHPETSRAARLLGVDYADAVTGFSFRGRHGTAIITGAVVAESCRDAVEEVISAFEIERQEEEEKGRILEALRMWKKFLVGLRIRERIQGYEIEGERKIADEAIGDGEENTDDNEGGEFLPDREMTANSKTVLLGNCEQTHDTYDDGDDDGGGGFLLGDEMDEGDSARMNKPRIDNFHKSLWQSDYQDPQGKLGDENKQQIRQPQSPFQPADRTKHFLDTDTEATPQGPTSQALQAPIKQHPQSRQQKARTANASKTHATSYQNESSRSISAGYLSQTTQPVNPTLPSSPTKPYLPDAEMDEALALQQIHDSQTQKPPKLPPLNHQESNLETSHLTPSSPRRQRSVPSSPTRNALTLPPPTTQILSPPPNQENLEKIVDAKPRSPLRHREPEDQAESKKVTEDDDDGNESEDAGSLLSRDPSDEEADPSWLDF